MMRLAEAGGDSHVSQADLDHSQRYVTDDNAKYLDELVRDMHTLNQVQLHRPAAFRHVSLLLCTEIDRVWNSIYLNRLSPSALSTPAHNEQRSSAQCSPIWNPVSSFNSPSPPWTPTTNRQASPPSLPSLSRPVPVLQSTPKNNARPSASPLMKSLSPSEHDDLTPHSITEKIPIPKNPDSSAKCNYIGRILGPRGISVKQLEAETDCQILIRGQGSVKDTRHEQRLIGRPGWEHLTEPLHVLITATDPEKHRCEDKMRVAIEAVKRLLTPLNDEHKKKQLIQLAIINGTYRSDDHQQSP